MSFLIFRLGSSLLEERFSFYLLYLYTLIYLSYYFPIAEVRSQKCTVQYE